MSQTFLAPLMGANFRPASTKEHIRNELSVGSELSLARDPYNEYDSNAVKVLDGDYFLGFVSKETAVDIAPLLDSGWTGTAKILSFLSEIKPHLEITLVETSGT